MGKHKKSRQQPKRADPSGVSQKQERKINQTINQSNNQSNLDEAQQLIATLTKGTPGQKAAVCSALAHLAADWSNNLSNNQSTNQSKRLPSFMQRSVLNLLIPMLLTGEFEVRLSVAGLLRNMSSINQSNSRLINEQAITRLIDCDALNAIMACFNQQSVNQWNQSNQSNFMTQLISILINFTELNDRLLIEKLIKPSAQALLLAQHSIDQQSAIQSVKPPIIYMFDMLFGAANHSTAQSSNQTIDQSNNQSIEQTNQTDLMIAVSTFLLQMTEDNEELVRVINQSNNQTNNQLLNQLLANPSVSPLVRVNMAGVVINLNNQSINQTVSPVQLLLSPSVDPSIIQSINPEIKQSIEQTINLLVSVLDINLTEQTAHFIQSVKQSIESMNNQLNEVDQKEKDDKMTRLNMIRQAKANNQANKQSNKQSEEMKDDEEMADEVISESVAQTSDQPISQTVSPAQPTNQNNKPLTQNQVEQHFDRLINQSINQMSQSIKAVRTSLEILTNLIASEETDEEEVMNAENQSDNLSINDISNSLVGQLFRSVNLFSKIAVHARIDLNQMLINRSTLTECLNDQSISGAEVFDSLVSVHTRAFNALTNMILSGFDQSNDQSNNQTIKTELLAHCCQSIAALSSDQSNNQSINQLESVQDLLDSMIACVRVAILTNQSNNQTIEQSINHLDESFLTWTIQFLNAQSTNQSINSSLISNLIGLIVSVTKSKYFRNCTHDQSVPKPKDCCIYESVTQSILSLIQSICQSINQFKNPSEKESLIDRLDIVNDGFHGLIDLYSADDCHPNETKSTNMLSHMQTIYKSINQSIKEKFIKESINRSDMNKYKDTLENVNAFMKWYEEETRKRMK